MTLPPRALVLLALTFPLAHGQAPLFYSNQNQYFLHGLARAGYGHLESDWLAGTLDPTPLFSALVAATARSLPLAAFHLQYALLQVIYAVSMLAIFVALVGTERAERRWPVFVLLFAGVHAAASRWSSFQLLGLDYPWYLQAGVAGQYVLGAMYQPSTFGVLLVLSIALFGWYRPWAAAVAIAVAATWHSTYLLPGALLTAGYLAALLQQSRYREALLLAVVALVLVLPITCYVGLTFGPTDAETFAEAQAILVDFRIPHHARVDLWLDATAVLQFAWVAVAIVLVRGTRLFLPLLVAFALMLVLTLVQALTGSTSLALLFPWRLSTVLVPVATTIMLAKLVELCPCTERSWMQVTTAGMTIAFAAAGIALMALRLGYRTSDDELPLLDFVRSTSGPGDVYLLPARIPDLAKTTRGSSSGDFKPLAAKRADAALIPPDLQRFRLHTGRPIYVDFKAIPYKDTEVLEWYRRLKFAEVIQDELRRGAVVEAMRSLRDKGVTHVVVPSDVPLPAVEAVYADSSYRVYAVH